MDEIWKDVYGYEGRYEVSNIGRVRSKNKDRMNYLLKQRFNHEGYCVVSLFQNGETKQKLVHVLVMQAFDFRERKCGYDKNLVIDHKDGNKTNNRLDNLEWCTQAENLRRSIEKGNRGRPCIDLTTGIVYQSLAEAGRAIGSNSVHVKQVCDGIHKTVKKHKFVYIGNKGAYKTKKHSLLGEEYAV